MNRRKHESEHWESAGFLKQSCWLTDSLCGLPSRMVLTLALLCAFAQALWSQSDDLKREWKVGATESLDSASYAFGDVIIRSLMENPDSVYPRFEYNEENLDELIRGMEENLAFIKYSQDTIKNISFRLGALQGVFLWDGFQFKMDAIPFDCLLAGLMKDVNHELTLPRDTVKVQEYMKSLPENMKPEEWPDEDKCTFFMNYGIMKGLQPGLQAYIHEETGKGEDEIPADYEAYAAGLATMVRLMSLEARKESEQGPYDVGMAIGGSIVMEPLPFHFRKIDFLDGCRAAAGLNERKMTVEDSDQFFSMMFPEK